MRRGKIISLCVLLVVTVMLAGCSGVTVRATTAGVNYHNAESQGLPTWEPAGGVNDPVQVLGIERML